MRTQRWTSYLNLHQPISATGQHLALPFWCLLSQSQDLHQRLHRQATFITIVTIGHDHSFPWQARGLPVTASICSPQLPAWGQAVTRRRGLRLWIFKGAWAATLVYLQSLRLQLLLHQGLSLIEGVASYTCHIWGHFLNQIRRKNFGWDITKFYKSFLIQLNLCTTTTFGTQNLCPLLTDGRC